MRYTKDARRFGRAAFLCRVSLPVGGGGVVEASSMDISLGGVGLISPAFVEEGRSVTLGFHLRDSAQEPVVERVPGRVVSVRSGVDGHRVRIKFLESIDRWTHPVLTRRVERL